MRKILLILLTQISISISAQLSTVYSTTPIKNIDCDFYVNLINNKFYFQGSDPFVSGQGAELFVSDSTEVGTVLVKNINPNSFGSSSPGNFTQLNSNSVLFTANDGTVGRELWITDGTNAGTSLVKDIYPGSNNGAFEHFTRMGNAIYFMANDGVDGNELWKSDGTTIGTQLVKNINPTGNGMQMPVLLYSKYTAVVSNTLFFVASDGSTGFELYKTDGTTSGTLLVKDLYTGSQSSNPSNFVVVNNILYFTCTSANDGNELWKTDGTTLGTVMVKDFSPLIGASSNPNYLVGLNNKLYFSALVSNKTNLCVSDGTTIGTNTLYVAPNFNSEFCRLTKVDSSIYFFDRSTGVAPDYSLYKYDLPLNNTILVKSGLYGGTSGPVYQPTKEKAVPLNGRLYFTFDDFTNGDELWESDGTTLGTKMITDIGVGPLTSWIDNLIPVSNGTNSRLYFISTKKTGLLYILPSAVTTNNNEIANSNHFSFYPNPSNETINVNFEEINGFPVTLSVFDVSGKILMSSVVKESKTEMNISHLAKGVYFVRVVSQNGVNTQKLIIN